MKLRIKGNSVRIRLDRRDLDQLLEVGRVGDAVRFGSGHQCALTYTVEVGTATRGLPQVDYVPGQIRLTIDRNDVEEWCLSERIGFDHQQPCEDGVVRVILEKDFACLDRPAGEETDDAWAFPNPSTVC